MASKRELIEPHKGDKRYVRRNPQGQFKESDDVGRRLPSTSARRPRMSPNPDRATKATDGARPANADQSARPTRWLPLPVSLPTVFLPSFAVFYDRLFACFFVVRLAGLFVMPIAFGRACWG